jgi:glycosyltransferase involved in cell wall biosynthesis
MKIAAVIENIATFGATQQQCIRVAENMKAMGHEVVLYTSKLDPKVSDGIEGRLDVRVVDTSLREGAAAFAERIRPEMNGLDWMFVFDWDVYRLKYFLPEKRVCWVCNDAPYVRNYLGSDILGRAKYIVKRSMAVSKEKRYISQIDKIIVLDGKMKKLLKRYYDVASTVVHSGIDMAADLPPEKESQIFEYLASKYHIKRKQYVFALGIAFRWRNFEVLMDSMKYLENISLIIVAPDHYDKGYFGELVERGKGNGRIVLEPNFVSEDEKTVLMKNALCFAFPNVQQTWGLAPLEALMQKTVPVVSVECGVTEVLEDGKYALLFDPRNASQLAAHIRSLADDPERRDRIANAGYEFVRKHLTWSGYAAEIMHEMTSEN